MLQVSTDSQDRLLAEAEQALARGDLARVEVLARQVLAVVPGHAGAWHRLGLAYVHSKQMAAGVDALSRAVAADPRFADAWSDLGTVLKEGQRLAEAEQAFLRCLQVDPRHMRARFGMADVYQRLGRLEDALAQYRAVLEFQPQYADLWLDVGRLLRAMGRVPESVEALRKAIAFKENHFEAWHDLGVTLDLAQQPVEAEAAFLKCLAMCPTHVGAHNNLGNLYKFTGRVGESEVAYRRALAINPRSAATLNNLGAVLILMGRCEAAAAAYREALRVEPGFSTARTGYLYCLQFVPEVDAGAVFEEHRTWERMLPPRVAAGHANTREAGRRLRVGYVSGDFRGHSVAWFIEQLLERHDRAGFEIFCYANVLVPDEVTVRLHKKADHWRQVAHLSDALLAEQIRRDQIDILVDLNGHTAGSRLVVFHLKPAPVQVSFLGYPNTTGLAAVDYRLTDGRADPLPAAVGGAPDCFYTEKLVRLGGSFLCYRPPEFAPAVEVGGAARPFMFVSFNALPKISRLTMRMWGAVLREVPGSRMFVKAIGLHDERIRGDLLARFAAEGVEAGRIEVSHQKASLQEHLGLYNSAEIALDTFPYHGTTTTCEALWMGVPVVTLAGDRHASRVGASLLTSVGLGELVASSEAEFVAKAVALAGDAGRQREIRVGLRERMRGSVLLDAVGYARAVEGAYREMWRVWCG